MAAVNNNAHHQDTNPNTLAAAAPAATPAKQTVPNARIIDTQFVLKSLGEHLELIYFVCICSSSCPTVLEAYIKGVASSVAVKRKRPNEKPKTMTKEEAAALKAREAARKGVEKREQPLLGL